MGEVHVNFDAEIREQALLNDEQFQQVYDFGLEWSETLQTSSSLFLDGDPERVKNWVRKFGRSLSINVVIGNKAYGLNPKFDSFEKISRGLSEECKVKLGVEGRVFGKKAIDLASEIGATAYILHTTRLKELLDYASSKKVYSVVYTLCRISDSSKSSAISEIMGIKAPYFKRRGIELSEIPMKVGDYAVFGTGEEVCGQIGNLLSLGTGKVVLCPVFKGTKDMLIQMRKLEQIIR